MRCLSLYGRTILKKADKKGKRGKRVVILEKEKIVR